jgi:hypothetical protein
MRLDVTLSSPYNWCHNNTPSPSWYSEYWQYWQYFNISLEVWLTVE